MKIDAPGVDAIDSVADHWVELAASQREFGAHLLADENRENARESLIRHAITGGLLVARDDETMLGFVSFYPEAGSYEQDVQRGIIENIYVIPERRGEGIGTALLERAEAELLDDGVEVLALEALSANDPALGFYQHHGYVPHRVELERDERETDTKGGE